jgi:hypothetical protein
MKAEPKSLESSLGLAISLGMSVMLTQSSIVASRQTMKRSTCALLNGARGLNLNHSYALA